MVADRNPESVAEVIAAGCRNRRHSERYCRAVRRDHHHAAELAACEEVALGEGGIIEGAKPGTVLIDMSSIAPLASRNQRSAESERRRYAGCAGQRRGPTRPSTVLSVMVGGDKAIFDKYYDLLKAMAGSVVHTGEIGAGNVTKLANQVIVALNIAAMSEALTLATKAA